MECRSALLAVKPSFACALVEGSKGFEFRRVWPSFQPGDLVYVYSSAPVQAIVGSFVCGNIVQGRPEAVWRRLRVEGNIPRSIFRDYFRGSRVASAIEVTNPHAWITPLPLAAIRRRIPEFHPPRSYKFLASNHPLLRTIARFSLNGAGSKPVLTLRTPSRRGAARRP